MKITLNLILFLGLFFPIKSMENSIQEAARLESQIYVRKLSATANEWMKNNKNLIDKIYKDFYECLRLRLFYKEPNMINLTEKQISDNLYQIFKIADVRNLYADLQKTIDNFKINYPEFTYTESFFIQDILNVLANKFSDNSDKKDDSSSDKKDSF